ncbi:CHAT domain-containing protein [Nostoc sp. TCL26-01]|uniref:CHAT domain-containing protein n=1 Tax=Nostoc sp. TCL26-01 TaxID=2576904 RepID=UPI0015BA864D|nr:CHAT domain-containing protein [Nostoc sp. TCL26-01]QLE54982.1 CHAT domain-containing protein [Nostoc sp. TCL26-01]
MKRSAKSQRVCWWFLPKLTHYSLTLLLSAVLMSDAMGATPRNRGLQIARDTKTVAQETISQTNTPDIYRVAAEKADAEANKLNTKTTPITQIIAKHKEALKYWRLAKDLKKEAQKLNTISGLYYVRGEYPQVLKYAQEAVIVCQAIGDRESEALATTFIALSYEQMGEYQKAIDAIKVSLQFTQHVGARFGILLNIARNHDKLGEKQKVLDSYNQALAFSKETGDVVKQAESLQSIAYHYFLSGEIDKSIEILQQANNLDPEFKREKSKTNLLYLSLSSLSCVDKLASLNKPSQIDKSVTNNSDPAINNNIENFQQNAQKYRTLEILRSEADFLELLGGLEYARIGEYQKALEVYQQALKLRQIMSAKPEEVETLTDIGHILNSQGKKQEAINALNQALDIQRQLKTRPAQANTLLTLGDVYLSLGAYSESLNAYKQALFLSQITGKRNDEIDTLKQIGIIYKKLQQYPQALNYYQQALSISQKTGNCQREAFLLVNISRHHFAAENYQQAVNFSNQALAVVQKLDIDEYKLSGESQIFDILAQVAIKQGNYAKALEYSQKARKLGRESAFKQIEANAIATIAEAYQALKQPQKAIQTYQEQLALYQEMGLLSEQAQSLYNIAKLQQQNNQLPAAITEIDKAIAIIENIRQEVASEDLRTSYFATVQDYYKFYIDLLMQLHKKDPSQGYDALALQVSDRSRARGLIELLTEANIDIKKGIDPKLLAEERRLQWQINAREKLLSELSSKKETPEQLLTNTKQQLQDLLKQQRELEVKIRTSNPEYADLKYPQPLTLKQIQQQLDKNTLLLQYSLGAERSYLWAVTPDSLHSYELPGREKIDKVAKNLYNNYLKNPGYQGVSPEDTAKAANELSQLILAPVADKLGQKRLVIVGDEALQYIPFAALTDLTPQPPSLVGKGEQDKLPSPKRRGVGGEVNYQPLVVNHEIISLPSASTIAIIRKQTKGRTKAPKTLAILADPVFSAKDERFTGKSSNIANNNIDQQLEESALKRSTRNINRSEIQRLPGTEQEAKEILKLVSPSENLQAFGFDANYNWATNKQLSQYKMLHFATHGFLDSTNPELSGIVLSLIDKQGKSQRGFLRLADIFNLNFPAELVVLSACETGLGKEVKGEGLVGLTRGLMYAGASRVVMSLWNVDDEATSLLMSQFYSQMLQQGKTPAAALRAAQLKMWEQEKWRNPYSWSAFTLLGEWE